MAGGYTQIRKGGQKTSGSRPGKVGAAFLCIRRPGVGGGTKGVWLFLIQVEYLTKRYGSHLAVDDISFI